MVLAKFRYLRRRFTRSRWLMGILRPSSDGGISTSNRCCMLTRSSICQTRWVFCRRFFDQVRAPTSTKVVFGSTVSVTEATSFLEQKERLFVSWHWESRLPSAKLFLLMDDLGQQYSMIC